MDRTLRILVQTTTPAEPDNWSIDSLSLLRGHLGSLREDGVCFDVTARNREAAPGEPDPQLARLDESDFDELWLFALDSGDGLTPADCQGITRFRQRGGGILSARDHQDMGSSLCTLGGVGLAHYFQTKNPEPDLARRVPDDLETPTISWPNYHSGRNGDCQRITAAAPIHELLNHPDARTGRIEYFPAHPHEGAVGAPASDPSARVVATGTSLTTGRPFNLVVAFERSRNRHGHTLGRAVAESSFHHFADYNWDTSRGAPSFVTEPEGTGMKTESRALPDIRRYVRNLAFWLAPAA
ncbi:MAG TPA: hypothetical protein VGK26_08165 [Thermoanaerobaculia bacterium]|jgi:hypothetical protein